MNFDKILYMPWYIQDACCMYCTLFMVNFLQNYGTWLTSEFCLFWISCELIYGFQSNFAYALILTRCRFGWLNNIFRSFSTELWPLIDVKISFMLNILWTNWWIVLKICKCINTDKVKVGTITNYFSLFFSWVMALDWCQNYFSILFKWSRSHDQDGRHAHKW